MGSLEHLTLDSKCWWLLSGKSFIQSAMIRTGAVLVLLGLLGPYSTQGQDVLAFKTSQNCQCECECPTPGDKKCLCDCECPRPGSSCGPGFTQVCPSPDGTCPEAYMPLCPEDLIAAAGRADTVAADRVAVVFSGIKHNIKCGKTTHKCTFNANIEEDCSSINSVKISCSPKKKCSKASATFAAGDRDRCLISGTYKHNGKKPTFSGMSIAVNPAYTTTTTTTTTTSTTTEGPKVKDYNCQCVPDFMLYMGQLAMGMATNRDGFMGSCVCVAGMGEGETPARM